MPTNDINNLISSAEANELLRFICKRDNLSLDDMFEEMRDIRRQEIIASHPYSIYKSTDGRWRTTVKNDAFKNNRQHFAKTSYEDLLDAIIDFYEGREGIINNKKITVEKLYPKWLEFKRLHTNSDASIYRITTEWKKHYLGTDIITIPIVDLTKLQLDEWAHKLIKHNVMTKKQYFNTSLIMRQVLEYAVDLEIIKDSPFSKVKIDGENMFRKVPKPASETQVFTDDEINMFHELAWEDFNALRHRKHQLIPLAAMFFFQTGMRISEICAIRYEDIKDEELHVQRMYSDFEKTVKDDTKGSFGDRFVPLTDDAKMLIETARKRQLEEGVNSNGYIFSMTDEPVPYSGLRKVFISYCEEAGFLPKSSHKARKTVVSTLIDDGVNINTIREMMGQKDERTTYNSYCFDRSDKATRLKQVNRSLSRYVS